MSRVRADGARATAAAAFALGLTWTMPAAAQDPDRAHARVSYERDIAPIVEARCGGCHRDGGAAPFPLASYDDVASRARLVASVVETGFMPPWLPREGADTFEGARRLDPSERAMLLQWLARPTRAPDERSEQALRAHTGARTPPATDPPDLRVTLAEPFTLAAEGADVFRSFVIPLSLKHLRYVRAIEIEPGAPRAVHHVTLGVDASRTARRLDAEDAAVGFDGMLTGAAQTPAGHFIGWTPGKGRHVSPPGLSWPLGAGDDIVLQAHLVPTGKPEVIRPSVAIWFTEDAPSKRALLARVGSTVIDVPPGAPAHVTEDAFELPVAVEVRAVSPHAHYRARRIEAVAHLPHGQTVPLVTIPAWDVRWQEEYRFVAPPQLPAGTRIVARVTFDNTERNVANPERQPVRAVYGPGAYDEMGDVWLQLVPAKPADAGRLARLLAARELEAQTKGYQLLARARPGSAAAHLTLAALRLQAGDYQLAIAALDRVLSLSPDSALALYTRGVAFERSGRLREAARDLRAALARDPRYAQAEHALGHVAAKDGRMRDAEGHFRRAVELWPEFADGWNSLGVHHAAAGAIDSAVADFRRVLAAAPEHREALNNLGILLARTGRVAEAVTLLERAVAAHPDDEASRQNLATARALRR